MPDKAKLLHQLRARGHSVELLGASTKYFHFGSLMLTIKEASALLEGRTTIEQLIAGKHQRAVTSRQVLRSCPNCNQAAGVVLSEIKTLAILECVACGHNWSAAAQSPR